MLKYGHMLILFTKILAILEGGLPFEFQPNKCQIFLAWQILVANQSDPLFVGVSHRQIHTFVVCRKKNYCVRCVMDTITFLECLQCPIDEIPLQFFFSIVKASTLPLIDPLPYLPLPLWCLMLIDNSLSLSQPIEVYSCPTSILKLARNEED
jgi:hypothetical protein